MGVNERPKRKNAGSKMTAIVSKEKEIDGNDIHETSSSDSNKTTEAIIYPDDNEDEPHIGIFQTPKIPDETTEAIIRPDDSENEPHVGIFQTPAEIPDAEEVIINNLVDCSTQTSFEIILDSHMFVRKSYFEDFYDEYLEFKYHVQSQIDKENNYIQEKHDLSNKISSLEQEVTYLKKINNHLKSEANSPLHIIKSLSEGNETDAPWQTTSSNGYKRTNENNYTRKDDNTCFKNIPVRNSNESLYVDDTQELEILVNRSTETQRRKPRSNRINKISRNEKSYNYRNSADESNNTIHNDNNNDNNVNARQKVVLGNWSYASATKYGKKSIVIGDSHLRRISRKLFNESFHLRRINRKLFNEYLPYCKGNIKYFSDA